MAKDESDILDLGRWCILRTASLDTLKVTEALKKIGFNVWTPEERKIGRMPRTRKAFDKVFPIMPSYVFAEAHQIDGLRSLSESPTRDCPHFSVFKYGDGFPLVSDGELEALRSEEKHRNGIFERQKAKKTKAPVFEQGLEVLLTQGGFEGLEGKVVESKGSFTLVEIPGFPQPIKIASLLLQQDVVSEQPTNDGVKAA